MTRRAPLRVWFAPGLIGLHLFWAVALVVCVLGGFWQLDAYEDRQGVAAREARQAGVVDIGTVWSAGEAFTNDLENRSVTVRGRFTSAAEQIWVQGPDTGGRAWLVAPFLVDGSDAALLVVRGETDRVAELPAVPDTDTALTVVLRPSSSGGTPLDQRRTTNAVTTAKLVNELPHRLWAGYGIVTDGDVTPTGTTPVGPPDPEVSWTVGLKNLAYTLQWWVFGAFSVFMWWRMISEQVAARGERDAQVA